MVLQGRSEAWQTMRPLRLLSKLQGSTGTRYVSPAAFERDRHSTILSVTIHGIERPQMVEVKF